MRLLITAAIIASLGLTSVSWAQTALGGAGGAGGHNHDGQSGQLGERKVSSGSPTDSSGQPIRVRRGGAGGTADQSGESAKYDD